MSPVENRAAAFASARPLLFSIAYRMLGSVMDAEDVVQDAYLRWQEAPDADVRAPHAYLATIVTRLAINQLRSARRQRETYVGPWLPEPLVTDHVPDPSGPVELAESLSMAFLVLLERLSPIERAVFLLREVFDFDYAEIARIVDKTEANCRQLLARAKQHVGVAAAIARSVAAEDGAIAAGLRRRLHDPVLRLSTSVRTALALGIVFVMSVKPSPVGTLTAIGVALLVGLAVGLPGWAGGRRAVPVGARSTES